MSFHEAILNFSCVLVWSILYIYAFNLLSQSLGVEEDAINKPDRPIPSGKVSRRAAWQRCAIVWSLFSATPLLDTRIIPENIIFGFFALFLSVNGPGGHWFGKNTVAMSVMGAAMLSTSQKLMSSPGPNDWIHVSALSIWAGLVTQVQDFRDQAGDKKRGRYTFPLAFGDTTARYIVAFFLLPLAFATIYSMGLGKNAPWLLAAMHVFLGYRLLAFRESKADHDTYMVRFIVCNPFSVTNLIGRFSWVSFVL
jgi:4-hydroxybenzoate polyprenyltransferase